MGVEPYLNFFWIEDGKVAGCAGPRSEADLAFLKERGIKAVVRMYPTIASQYVVGAGLTDCLIPVEDFRPPLPEDIDHMVAFVRRSVAEGAPVAVSCRAGDGRTGVVLGCYLVSKGLSAREALAQLWARYPGYLETPQQEDAVYQYEERLKSKELSMQRIPFVKMEEAPQEVHSLFGKMASRGARVLNLHRVLAHSPAAALNFIRLGNSLLERSRLERKLRELAVLRVSYLAGCDYEWAHHLPIALRSGLSRQQAASIARWQEATVFDEKEKALLRYTDEVALRVQVEPETFATVRRYLDEVSIVELTLSIAYWGMTARLIVAMQIELEDDYKGGKPFQIDEPH